MNPDLEQALERIEWLLHRILFREALLVALGQDILDAVAAESTVIDSVVTLINGLVSNGTIPPAVGTQILSNIAANKDKLQAAIVANTPPPPPA